MSTRITPQEHPSKKIVFLRGERMHAGIDVHKQTYSVALWCEQRQQVLSRWTQPADPDALMKALTTYRKRIDGVVYEAGPTGYSLVRALRTSYGPGVYRSGRSSRAKFTWAIAFRQAMAVTRQPPPM